jgi:hypothetical protein
MWDAWHIIKPSTTIACIFCVLSVLTISTMAQCIAGENTTSRESIMGIQLGMHATEVMATLTNNKQKYESIPGSESHFLASCTYEHLARGETHKLVVTDGLYLQPTPGRSSVLVYFYAPPLLRYIAAQKGKCIDLIHAGYDLNRVIRIVRTQIAIDIEGIKKLQDETTDALRNSYGSPWSEEEETKGRWVDRYSEFQNISIKNEQKIKISKWYLVNGKPPNGRRPGYLRWLTGKEGCLSFEDWMSVLSDLPQPEMRSHPPSDIPCTQVAHIVRSQLRKMPALYLKEGKVIGFKDTNSLLVEDDIFDYSLIVRLKNEAIDQNLTVRK